MVVDVVLVVLLVWSSATVRKVVVVSCAELAPPVHPAASAIKSTAMTTPLRCSCTPRPFRWH